MFDQNHNHFRPIALLLISLTIITVGVIYNQAVTSPSRAQFFGTSTQTNTGTSTNSTPPVEQTPQIDTNTSGNNLPTEPAPTTNTNPSTDTNIDTDTNTDTNLPELTLEDIWISLQLLNQLTKTSNLFAYSTIEVKLPDMGATTQTPIPAIQLPDINLPDFINDTTIPPPTNQSTDNEVLAIIKDWSGYSKWEEFKTNFITAKEQYSGTGRCMIDIQGLGCLVPW